MTITAEKLQGWIYKPCPGGVVLQLLHDQAGPTLGIVVASFGREEVLSARDAGVNQAEQIIDEAQAHADTCGEACKFLIQWTSEQGRALRTIIHRVTPSEPTQNVYAANADAISTNAMVAQFLGHIHAQQKVVNGSFSTVCTAFERAMGMQQAMLMQMNELVKTHRKELAALTAVESLMAPEDIELSKLKARAFEKLIELGPDVFRVLASAVGARIAGEPENDNADEAASAPAPNGAGGHLA